MALMDLLLVNANNRTPELMDTIKLLIAPQIINRLFISAFQVWSLALFFMNGRIIFFHLLCLLISTSTCVFLFYIWRKPQEADVCPGKGLYSITLIPMMLTIASSTILWAILLSNSGYLSFTLFFLAFIMGNYISLLVIDYCLNSETLRLGNFFKNQIHMMLISFVNAFYPIAPGKNRLVFAITAISSYVMRAAWIVSSASQEISRIPSLLTCISNETYANLTSSGKPYNETKACYSLQSCFCGFQCSGDEVYVR